MLTGGSSTSTMIASGIQKLF